MPNLAPYDPTLPTDAGIQPAPAKSFTSFIILTDGVPSIATDAEAKITDALTIYMTDSQAAYYHRALDLLQRIRDLDHHAATPGLFFDMANAGGGLDKTKLLRIRIRPE